jgi:hypothetical protein
MLGSGCGKLERSVNGVCEIDIVIGPRQDPVGQVENYLPIGLPILDPTHLVRYIRFWDTPAWDRKKGGV